MIFPDTNLKNRFYTVKGDGCVIGIHSYKVTDGDIGVDENNEVNINRFPWIKLVIDKETRQAYGLDYGEIYLWLDDYINVGGKYEGEKFTKAFDGKTEIDIIEYFNSEVENYIHTQITNGVNVGRIIDGLPNYLKDIPFPYRYKGDTLTISSIEVSSGSLKTYKDKDKDELIKNAAIAVAEKAGNDVLKENGLDEILTARIE